MVTKFFGNTVTLDDIQIVESGWRHHIATRGDDGKYLTVGNTIYGKNMTDGLLIHEVAHVWQYSRDVLDPVKGGVKHGIAEIRERRGAREKSLYYYRLDDLNKEGRRTFRDYGFEQQAQILQDAYEYLYTDTVDFRYNDEFLNRSDYWQEYYKTLLEEFQEYHRQLLDQKSSSSGHLEFN